MENYWGKQGCRETSQFVKASLSLLVWELHIWPMAGVLPVLYGNTSCLRKTQQ